jgi:hypothetical protein
MLILKGDTVQVKVGQLPCGSREVCRWHKITSRKRGKVVDVYSGPFGQEIDIRYDKKGKKGYGYITVLVMPETQDKIIKIIPKKRTHPLTNFFKK